MGAPISPGAVSKARPPDHTTARPGRSGVHQQLVKRPRRADQHPDPPDHPPRVRLPLTRRRHRHRDALTRRALPTPTRTVTAPTVASVASKSRTELSEDLVCARIREHVTAALRAS